MLHVVWSSGGRVSLRSCGRHRTSWLLNCAPSSETIADSLSSSGQLTFSGHFHVLLDSTTSTTSSFLSYLLALLLIPSIHFPTHPPTHSSIHTSTHHPFIHPPIHPGTDGWMNERVGE